MESVNLKSIPSSPIDERGTVPLVPLNPLTENLKFLLQRKIDIIKLYEKNYHQSKWKNTQRQNRI